MAMTEHLRWDVDLQMIDIHMASEFVLAVSLFLYCGFAALHSVSHVEEPCDRMCWIVLTVVFNVAGSLVYYLTKYQDFRSHRIGGLSRPRVNEDRSFFRATSSELKEAEQDVHGNTH